MTLSIWGFVDILTSEEASLLYNGADPDDFEMRRNHPDDHFKKQGMLHCQMVIAAQKGELKPCGVEVAKRNEKGEVDRDLTTGMFGWSTLSDDDFSWKKYPIDLVRFFVDRQELYRWLTTRVNKFEIPAALCIQPEPEENATSSSAKLDELNEQQQDKLKRTRQGNAILETLREMGVEPTRLPYREPGKKGFRSDVRKKLLASRRDLFTEKSYEKSWQRLRDSGCVCEITLPPKLG